MVREPVLPTEDATDVPFVTIDPVGSRDLDQAFHFERHGQGYLVRYAIADVSAFVRPGSALEAEAESRGQTLYAPDVITLLHPPVIALDAGSLLPDEVRPALVWTLEIDRHGENIGVDVRRALIKSRAQLDYPSAQQAVDDGTADEQLLLLREIGELRQALERERGGITLPVPEQQVVRDGRRMATRVRGPVADRVVERPDLADDRDGGGRAHALRRGRDPPHPPGAVAVRDPADPPRRDRPWRALASADEPRRVRPDPGPNATRSRGADRGCDRAASWGWLRRLRRWCAGAGGARRGRLGVRPCHRAATPPGRPVRRRDLRRAVRRRGAADLGAVSAPAHRDGR